MAGQLIPRGKNVWLIRVYLGHHPDTGKREYHNKTVHGTKKDAEGELVRLLRDRDKGHLAPGAENRTVGALLDDLLLDYKVNGKSIQWAEIVVEKHLRPFFGDTAIPKVGTPEAKRYIAHRHGKGIANATINRELALLRRAFNLGRMSTPPKVTRVPYIPTLEENNVRKGFFEHDAYLAIRGALRADVRPVLTFAYYTGCRRGEILNLRWEQVDLIERIIRLEPGETKNEEARVIPLSSELYQTLTMQRSIRDKRFPDCPWVFFRYDTGTQVRDFRDAWEYACCKSGLWAGDPKDGKPTKLFHDLRRTGVRNLIRAGVPERVAMQISGHKTRAVFDRYNIVSEADLKDAARRLDAYLSGKTAAHTGTQSEDRHTIGTQGAFSRKPS